MNMPEIKLRCACGQVKGTTENVNANSGTRIDCCCIDCQKFAQLLGNKNQILDQYGGTDIFQIPLAHVSIYEGHEQLACVRLSPKGLYRWYAKCCNTPIGNTMNGNMPFIGIIHNFMDNKATRDADLGKSRGHIHVESAIAEVPAALRVSLFKITLRVLRKLIIWKIKGLNKPSAFFCQDGKVIVKPSIAAVQTNNA
jgi:hypothetical protein